MNKKSQIVYASIFYVFVIALIILTLQIKKRKYHFNNCWCNLLDYLRKNE